MHDKSIGHNKHVCYFSVVVQKFIYKNLNICNEKTATTIDIRDSFYGIVIFKPSVLSVCMLVSLLALFSVIFRLPVLLL